MNRKRLKALQESRDIITSLMGSADQSFVDNYDETVKELVKMEELALKEITTDEFNKKHKVNR